MKKKFLTLLLLFPAIFCAGCSDDEIPGPVEEPVKPVEPVDKPEKEKPVSVAWIDFSDNTAQHITFSKTDDPGQGFYTEAVTYENTPCRKIGDGKFLYLQVERTAVPSTERELIIAITYFDDSNGQVAFDYNAVGNDNGAAFRNAGFSKNGSKSWVTSHINLTDAELSGKMFGSDDLRIGGLNYIKKIEIFKGSLDPGSEPIPARQNLQENQFKGKSFAGYQIWHHAGPSPSDWSHWSYGNVPAPGYHQHNGVNVCSYPDVSEYEDYLLFDTNLGNLGDGRKAGLYHSKDRAVIQKQMGWLRDAGVDGVAIQRFVGGIGRTTSANGVPHLVYAKEACENTQRLFYICYDLNGADNSIVERIKSDWVYEIEQASALTSSRWYATVGGRPVVEVWGVGHNMATADQCKGIIAFLQSRGCYVIGGTPRDWRDNPANGFAGVFENLDCISPWTVGVYSDISGAENYLNSYMMADMAYCRNRNIDYLPVVFPGSGNWLNDSMQFSQTFRQGGKFLWAQVLNAKSLGANAVYYAMLDEFEESTNLIKGAVDYFDIPVDQYFETFSRDGIWVSSDYYLRLAAYAAKMLRGEMPVTDEIPVPYSEGPIYYRNSFESKLSTLNKNGSSKPAGEAPDYKIVLPVDPCFYKDKQWETENVNDAVCQIVKTETAHNGQYAVHFSGNSSSSQSKYSYQIAEVKIPVKAGMKFSFWKYTGNEAGKYTSVDLLFKSGKRLSKLNGYTDQQGRPMKPESGAGVLGDWGQTVCTIGTGDLVGDEVTGILLSYHQSHSADAYEVYFDDIIFEDDAH